MVLARAPSLLGLAAAVLLHSQVKDAVQQVAATGVRPAEPSQHAHSMGSKLLVGPYWPGCRCRLPATNPVVTSTG